MKQVKKQKRVVKIFVFSFLCIFIIFAVIFVYAIYRYYHKVQNRQDEISSDYSQHMAEQANRRKKQITSAPDRYIQDFNQYYQVDLSDESDFKHDRLDEGSNSYTFKFPDEFVKSELEKSSYNDVYLSTTYNDESLKQNLKKDYPIYFQVYVDYHQNMPEGNNQAAMEEIILYLLKPVYPEMTLEKVQAIIENKDDDNEGSEIYRGGFRRNEDRGFGFDFYLRYPLS